jgi:hypothetical protein
MSTINQDFEFTRSDVEGLAKKLASVLLSERERSLLLAILAAAREHVVRIPPKAPEDLELTGANLHEQIINAFIPDENNEVANLLIQSPARQSRISPIPIKPPPPPPPSPPK